MKLGMKHHNQDNHYLKLFSGNNHGGEDVAQETFVNCADVMISVNGGPDPRPTKETGALNRKIGGVMKHDENVRTYLT